MEDMLIFDHVCQYNEHLEQETHSPNEYRQAN